MHIENNVGKVASYLHVLHSFRWNGLSIKKRIIDLNACITTHINNVCQFNDLTAVKINLSSYLKHIVIFEEISETVFAFLQIFIQPF